MVFLHFCNEESHCIFLVSLSDLEPAVLADPSLHILHPIQVVNGNWFWQCEGFSSECFPGFFTNEVLTCSFATCGADESVISMCIAFVLPAYAVLASVVLAYIAVSGQSGRLSML